MRCLRITSKEEKVVRKKMQVRSCPGLLALPAYVPACRNP